MEKATFAAGCFWGVESAFRKLMGVLSTQVGYTGGKKDNPTYEEVCTSSTQHVEAIEVVYDPCFISYEELLNTFWDIHDPTTLNRQGFDIGSQYRSAIFYHNSNQERLAKESRKKQNESGRFDDPIVTEIIPASKFWKAEEYHQKYYEKKGTRGCDLN